MLRSSAPRPRPRRPGSPSKVLLLRRRGCSRVLVEATDRGVEATKRGVEASVRDAEVSTPVCDRHDEVATDHDEVATGHGEVATACATLRVSEAIGLL